MSKIIKFPKKYKKPIKDTTPDEFDESNTWETNVDLSLEMHGHDIRDLTNWCKDQDYKIKQAYIALEDLHRDMEDVKSTMTMLVNILTSNQDDP